MRWKGTYFSQSNCTTMCIQFWWKHTRKSQIDYCWWFKRCWPAHWSPRLKFPWTFHQHPCWIYYFSSPFNDCSFIQYSNKIPDVWLTCKAYSLLCPHLINFINQNLWEAKSFLAVLKFPLPDLIQTRSFNTTAKKVLPLKILR